MTKQSLSFVRKEYLSDWEKKECYKYLMTIKKWLYTHTIKKGWFVFLKTRFSAMVCSISLFCMTSSFLKIFIANNFAVDFSRHKITLPYEPLPRTLINSKFSRVYNETKIKKSFACCSVTYHLLLSTMFSHWCSLMSEFLI